MIGTMKAAFIVYAATGAFFGLIVGWILGTQQATGRVPFAAAAPAAQMGTAAAPPSAKPAVDEAQAAALRAIAEKDPANVQSRVQLGNIYFDAERYQDAIRWYDEAFKLNTRDVGVSTDLGVCYYYTDQADRAIRQLEESLRIDPKHTKTLLNLGIVKAFGKQDLAGATAAWQQVIALEPTSPEAQAAQRAIANLAAAHPGGAAMPPAGTPAATQTPKPGGMTK
jgi:cytochrome c-type biogenesis protein CcmH/NrfG